MGRKKTQFVLKPKGTDIYALASRVAMVCYAKTILEEDPELFKELMNWAAHEHHLANGGSND